MQACSEIVPCTVGFESRENPFAAGPRRLFATGISVDQMLVETDTLPAPGLPVSVTVDGVKVEAAYWPATFPGNGAVVVAAKRPRISAIASAIVAALVPSLTAAEVGVLVGGSLAGLTGIELAVVGLYAVTYVGVAGGISFALSAITNAIVGEAGQPNSNFSPAGRSPAVAGTRNQARLNSPVPKVYGRHRMTFPLAALPSTEIAGNDQFLRMLFSAGYGPIDGTTLENTLQIGNTPIDDFEDVQYKVHDGVTGYVDGFPTFEIAGGTVTNDVLASLYQPELGPPGDLDAAFEVVNHTTSSRADEISTTMVFGGGLFHVSKKGNEATRSVDIKIEIRRTDPTPGAWLNAMNLGTFTWDGHPQLRVRVFLHDDGEIRARLTGNIHETAYFQTMFKVPSGRGFYELRVTGYPAGRIGIGPDLGDPEPVFDANLWSRNRGGTGEEVAVVVEDFTWTDVVTRIFEKPVNHKNQAFVELRIKASEELNGVVDNLRGIVQGKVEVYDPIAMTWSAPMVTQNPVWHAADILRNFGGIPDSRLDLQRFAAAAAVMEPTAGVYDRPHSRIFDFDTNVMDAMRDVLAAGFAAPHRSDGVWTILLEENKTVHTQVYSARNTQSNAYNKILLDLPHCIRVKFVSEHADWLQDELPVYSRGYGLDAVDSTLQAATFVGTWDKSSDTLATTDPLINFQDMGVKANTWITIDATTHSEGSWRSTVGADHNLLVRSVADQVITFWDGQINADFTSTVTVLTTLEATKFETIEAHGVATVGLAWKHGRRHVILGPPRSNFTTFDADWEYLASERGDLIEYSSFVLDGKKQACRITGFEYDPDFGFISHILVDDEIQYLTGQFYGILIREPDGIVLTSDVKNLVHEPPPDQIATGETSSRLHLDPGIAKFLEPAIGSLVVFGVGNDITEQMNVVKVQPLEGYRAKLLVQPQAGPFIDQWLEEVEPTSVPLAPAEAVPGLAPPATPALIFAGIRVATASPAAATVTNESSIAGPSGVEVGFEVVVDVVPNSPGPGQSVTVAYDGQFRIHSFERGFLRNGVPGPPRDVVTRWHTFASSEPHTPLVGFLVNYVFPVTEAAALGVTPLVLAFGTNWNTIDVRVRAVAAVVERSEWVQIDSVTPFETSVETPTNLRLTRKLAYRGGDSYDTDALIEWDAIEAIINHQGAGRSAASYRSRYRVIVQNEDEILVDTTTHSNQLSVQNVKPGLWTISVQYLNSIGVGGFPAFLSKEYSSIGLDITLLPPSGIRLSGGDAVNLENSGPDFIVEWNQAQIGVNLLEDDVDENDVDVLPSAIEAYIVETYDRLTMTLMRSEEVKETRYVYTYQMNLLDNSSLNSPNSPNRYLVFRVFSKAAGKLSKTYSTLAPQNTPPAFPRHVSGQSHINGWVFELDWDGIADPRLQGLKVWAREGVGDLVAADLIEANVVFDGKPTRKVAIFTDDLVFTYAYAAYDQFSSDPDELNVSTSFKGNLSGIDDDTLPTSIVSELIQSPRGVVSAATLSEYDRDFGQDDGTGIFTDSANNGPWAFDTVQFLSSGRALKYTTQGDEITPFASPCIWLCDESPTTPNIGAAGQVESFEGDIFNFSYNWRYDPSAPPSFFNSIGSRPMIAFFNAAGTFIGVQYGAKVFDAGDVGQIHLWHQAPTFTFAAAPANTAYAVFGVALSQVENPFVPTGSTVTVDNFSAGRLFAGLVIRNESITQTQRDFSTTQDGATTSAFNKALNAYSGVVSTDIMVLPAITLGATARQAMVRFDIELLGTGTNEYYVMRKETGTVTAIRGGDQFLEDSSKNWKPGEFVASKSAYLVLRPGGGAFPEETRKLVSSGGGILVPTGANWTNKPGVGDAYEVVLTVSGLISVIGSAGGAGARATISGGEEDLLNVGEDYTYALVANKVPAGATTDIEGQLQVFKL